MNEPRLFLHTSNRMEDLAALLAERHAQRASPDPFQTETVMVQSRGMARWLSLQLADAHEICFNVRYDFPRQAIEEILTAVVPNWKGGRSFGRETMVWSLFRALGEYRTDRRFAAIGHYLQGDDLLKRIQLADRLASLFDQYLVYRPDWLMNWEKGGEPEDWQAILWRRLVKDGGGETHIAHAWANLQTLPADAVTQAKLPPRLCVFGISSLPPLFLQVLHHYASRGGELHLYLLQPTESYWGDLISQKKQAKLPPGEALYLEEGHPLVASLGRQGQDLLNLLIDADFQQPEEGQMFEEPMGDSLLHRLQADILKLVERDSSDANKILVAEEDSSIQVHSCHSPMREVEVLHDQLTDLFTKSESLRPRDVLVMIPDIEAYAPYIDAVFGAPETGRIRIPYSVVDRGPRTEFQAIDGWFRLLELAGSRFGARDVVSLLESPAFRIRFGLGDRDIANLREWIQETGIRWGVDGEHRGEHGLADVSETTWKRGIEQWILGFAMRENQEGKMVSFADTFPFDEIEGRNIALADLFLKALQFLFQAREMLTKPRSLAEWCETLTSLLENLYGEIEDLAFETKAIRTALDGLGKTGKLVGSPEPLSIDVLRYFLEKSIDDTVSRGGFLSGGVTFCTLQPMRTVPARVVCLLGMNEGAFPRRLQQLGFDRLRDDRRVGDRSVREDDRYLFLETLLSVREVLLISYIGQSARDLSVGPPSVLVSELLDHLDSVCQFPEGEKAHEHLVQRHRLQPFHSDYFSGGKLLSYSEENAEACRRLIGDKTESEPFAADPLTEPDENWKTVAVGQLVNLFKNPSRYFLKERLGLMLPREEAILEDSEVFQLNRLEEYSLRKGTVDELVQKTDPSDWRRLQVRGVLPLGEPGVIASHVVKQEGEKFFNRLVSIIGKTGEPTNLAVDRQLDDFQIRGEIGPFFNGKLVVYRPSNLKPNDAISAWIQHLIACWINGGAVTVVVAQDKIVELSPEPEPEEALRKLLGWYWQGLGKPLPFFPAAGWTYAVGREKDEAKALQSAWKSFLGSGYSRGDFEDEYVQMCWKNVSEEEVLNEQFREISKTVFAAIKIFNGKSIDE